MLGSLLVDLDLDLMLFIEVLKFSLLVSKLGLFVFQFFLTNKPEVVDSESLIIVLTGELFFLLDGLLKSSAL
jgi:hypothetical protein